MTKLYYFGFGKKHFRLYQNGNLGEEKLRIQPLPKIFKP